MRQKQAMRAREGAAMVEAAIALPLLGFLLVMMPAVHERQAARQQALAAARNCAFAYALNGCNEVPVVCGAPPGTTSAPVPSPEHDAAALAQATAGDELAVFDELPLIGDALGAVLGETTHARASIELRPRDTDEAPARIEGALILACNERPRDVLAIARSAFCDHVPLIDCGGSP